MKQKKCKWCGKPFTPKHNRQVYGVDGEHKFTITRNGKQETTTCKQEARREQKRLNELQRYHQQDKDHRIYYPNNDLLGTTNPSTQHKKSTFKEEYQSIQKELLRLGLRHKTLTY